MFMSYFTEWTLVITYEQDPHVIETLPAVKHPSVDDSHPLTD
jgi:hypothetical protein